MNDDLILIVDEEVPVHRLLSIALKMDNHKTIVASHGKEGLMMAITYNPNLIILDLNLPDIDGIDLLKQLREWYERPIIILSTRNSSDDIIRALDLGADDYLTKPFHTGELLARIRTVIRRSRKNDTVASPVINIRDLNIDIANHIVRKNGKILKLTFTEFSLLAMFARNQGRVLTHEYIHKEVWGTRYINQNQSLRVYITMLRKKIEKNPAVPTLLVTISRIGYRFG